MSKMSTTCREFESAAAGARDGRKEQELQKTSAASRAQQPKENDYLDISLLRKCLGERDSSRGGDGVAIELDLLVLGSIVELTEDLQTVLRLVELELALLDRKDSHWSDSKKNAKARQAAGRRQEPRTGLQSNGRF